MHVHVVRAHDIGLQAFYEIILCLEFLLLCLPDESSSFTFRILFIKFILMDYYRFGQVIGACILLVSNWGIIYSLGMALSIRLEVFSGQELESAFFVLCFGISSVALKFNISSFCLPMLRNYLDIIFVTFCLQ